jgi:photosystem II stability/assembly factor-like uncharacterized protein
MNPQTKRLVLTSVNQLISLVKANPNIAAAVPKLAQLGEATYSTAPKKSCNCGAKANITTTDANKQTAENILSSLVDSDFQQIKSVLGLTELCYYKRQDNQLKMLCL